MKFWHSLLTLLIISLISTVCTGDNDDFEVEKLFTKAAKHEQMNRFAEAIETYQDIINHYPHEPVLDKAYFMIGFIKSENLDDKEGASVYFQSVIDKYPDSDLVDDALFMLKSIEQGTDALTTFEKSSEK